MTKEEMKRHIELLVLENQDLRRRVKDADLANMREFHRGYREAAEVIARGGYGRMQMLVRAVDQVLHDQWLDGPQLGWALDHLETTVGYLRPENMTYPEWKEDTYEGPVKG